MVVYSVLKFYASSAKMQNLIFFEVNFQLLQRDALVEHGYVNVKKNALFDAVLWAVGYVGESKSNNIFIS